MGREYFSIPSTNPDFPPTLEDCGCNPETCPFLEGLDVEGKIYDPHCGKTLPNTRRVKALVSGWNRWILLEVKDISKVMCGQATFNEGIERKV